jgi:hypothetical protein
MSQSLASGSNLPSSSSSFKAIFDKALNAFKIKSKQDLTTHPLGCQLQACNSPADILTILQDQVRQFEQSRSGDERLRRWLSPTINVLYAFSETLGRGIGLVNINRYLGDHALITIPQIFSPAQAIFAGAGVLLLVGARLLTGAGLCDIGGS